MNRGKFVALEGYGLEIVERVPLEQVAALIMLLADGNYAVRFAAFESLRDKQEEARSSLLDMIKKPDGDPEYARKLAGDLLEGDNGGKTPAERTIRDTP